MTDRINNKSVRAWVWRIITILVSGLVCWYYLRRVQWSEVRAALAGADLALGVTGLVLPNLVWWALDARLNQVLIGYFHKPVDFKGIFWVRGFTYLAAIINPPLAEGGMYLYLYRKTGMPGKLFTGVMLFKLITTALGLLLVLTAATISSYFLGLDLAHYINIYLWWAMLLAGYVVFFMLWAYWIKGISLGPLDRLLPRDSEFFIPYSRGRKKYWYITWAYTVPPLMLTFIGYYFAALAFRVKVGFVVFVMLSPLVFGLAGLPVFFGGYGSTTAFWKQFFPGSGTEQAITALTLVFLPTVRMLLRIVIGLVSMIPAQEDIALILRKRD